MVWVAAVPGGGRQLNSKESWSFDVNAGTTGGRVWARTGCNFDGFGHGSYQTGDCSGLLQCQAYGVPPNTLAEFTLNQYLNLDFLDISLVDGFNVPMVFNSTSPECSSIDCTGDLNGNCPIELKAPGGCNNPCAVFKTKGYCLGRSHVAPWGGRGPCKKKKSPPTYRQILIGPPNDVHPTPSHFCLILQFIPRL